MDISKMEIAPWKISELTENYDGGFLDKIVGIDRETEKAALVVIRWSYCSSVSRTIKVWIPKSAIYDKDHLPELTAAQTASLAAQREKYTDAVRKYNNLISWAKEHGVKGVRSKMKTATIMKKIADAGLVYNELESEGDN